MSIEAGRDVNKCDVNEHEAGCNVNEDLDEDDTGCDVDKLDSERCEEDDEFRHITVMYFHYGPEVLQNNHLST